MSVNVSWAQFAQPLPAPVPCLPAGQSWQVTLPAAENWPSSQFEQPRPSLSDLVLAAQSPQAAVPAAALKVPGMQAMQEVYPGCAWYRPAAQATQSVALVPTSDATDRRPTGHGVQVADGEYPTVLLHHPAGQERQVGGLAVARFCPPSYRCSMRPAGHD